MAKIRKEDIEKIANTYNQELKKYKKMIMVCTGTGCVSSGGFKIRDRFNEIFGQKNIQNEYVSVGTGCMGFCAAGPIVVIEPDGIFYQKVSPEDVDEIIQSHLLEGKTVERLLHKDSVTGIINEHIDDIAFFSKQQLIALRNKGIIDPEKIDNYISRKGYTGLKKVLDTNNPDEIVSDIIASGIRGRGGGGFPTGVKWKSGKDAATKQDEEIYVVCNADEGDPGAYMDRSIIEADPFSIIEGMTIGAFAVGSHEGFVYIRKEYPLALERLQKALKQAREYGLLGKNILDSGFDFDIQIHIGAGAFVCGESSALMTAMSGKAGEPKAKYIRSVEKGFRDKPTILNNVETWANIPAIIEKGAEWFASIGTGDVAGNPWDGSSGTKVFSLVGDVRNSGLVEVPMGLTLREIVEDIGGGVPEGRTLKAVQTGGPSGGCIPESLLDTKVDFDSLTKVGSMMGSGGMIVVDNTTCMVDFARYFTEFLSNESCGKCTPCREGVRTMKDILTRICNGEGKEGDVELLEEIGETVKLGSLCELGKSAPNPVLSTIKYFRHEYEEHIKDHKCRAGVCKSLISYNIIAEKCVGCTACAKACPVDAITGEVKGVHVIDLDKCTKCGICMETCKFDAVEVK